MATITKSKKPSSTKSVTNRVKNATKKLLPKYLDFDSKAAASGSFSNEFNRWLKTVVDSQCVDSVLNAGLLCRAIKAHAAEYLTETVGMGAREAGDRVQQIIYGDAEADEGHRIYGILGIPDPSE